MTEGPVPFPQSIRRPSSYCFGGSPGCIPLVSSSKIPSPTTMNCAFSCGKLNSPQQIILVRKDAPEDKVADGRYYKRKVPCGEEEWQQEELARHLSHPGA